MWAHVTATHQCRSTAKYKQGGENLVQINSINHPGCSKTNRKYFRNQAVFAVWERFLFSSRTIRIHSRVCWPPVCSARLHREVSLRRTCTYRHTAPVPAPTVISSTLPGQPQCPNGGSMFGDVCDFTHMTCVHTDQNRLFLGAGSKILDPNGSIGND